MCCFKIDWPWALGYLMLLGELNFWKIQPMKLSWSTDPQQKEVDPWVLG